MQLPDVPQYTAQGPLVPGTPAARVSSCGHA